MDEWPLHGDATLNLSVLVIKVAKPWKMPSGGLKAESPELAIDNKFLQTYFLSYMWL